MKLEEYIQKKIDTLKMVEAEYMDSHERRPDVWKLDEDEKYWDEIYRLITVSEAK